MSDLIALRARGIPCLCVVDANGVALNGTAGLTSIHAMGMEASCQVNASGIEPNTSATPAQLRARGLLTFCQVTELGVDPVSGDSTDLLRKRGIIALCPVDALGIAQGGTAGRVTLRKRSIGFFCPLDETGTAITIGTDPLAPAAPSFTSPSPTSDTTPDLTTTLPTGSAPLAAAVGDVLHAQSSANGGGSWDEYFSHTLDAGDLVGTPTFVGVTPIVAGSYLFRERLERTTHNSPWSASVPVTVTSGSSPANARIQSTGNYRLQATGNYRKTA